MSSNNDAGCIKIVSILAGLATIVGVIIAILAWLVPFSPTAPSPLTHRTTEQQSVITPQVSPPTTEPTQPSPTVAKPAPVFPSITIKPNPTSPPTMPVATSVAVSDGITPFGESKNIGGLVVTIGTPDYDSGCGGTMDFEVTLSNQTSTPIVLSFGLQDMRILGNGERQLSLYGDAGAATPRCYGDFRLETLAPNTAVKFALRTTESLGKFSYIDLVFGDKAGRLSGQKWRLDLTRTFNTKRTYFGETANLQGLEVTVGGENYFPGCGGTLGFQVTMRNTTNQPIILGMSARHLKSYGSNQKGLSTYSQIGKQSTDCYEGFSLETIKAGETVLIAVRNTDSLSGLSYVDFVFETANRLNGLRWRLNLPR